jgi:hypothetical protein
MPRALFVIARPSKTHFGRADQKVDIHARSDLKHALFQARERRGDRAWGGALTNAVARP